MSDHSTKSKDKHGDHFDVRSFEIAQLLTELYIFLCAKNKF